MEALNWKHFQSLADPVKLEEFFCFFAAKLGHFTINVFFL